jgi:polyphosphate glucokinase
MATMLGIDIGGTGIKGAPVDSATGELIAPRHRILTPHPATPDAVAAVVAKVAQHFDWTGAIGATFPAVVKEGVVQTAANVDKSWIGTNAAEAFAGATGAPVTALNDADAAGYAEMEFGAGKGRDDTVIVVTLGTGIGSAVFSRGHLVPNTELGHLPIRGKDAERRSSELVRETKQLSWKRWTKRLNEYFALLEALFWPDLIIIGGGISKKSAKFLPLLNTRAELVPAQLLNEAGIVGAAVAAGHAASPAPSPTAGLGTAPPSPAAT